MNIKILALCALVGGSAYLLKTERQTPVESVTVSGGVPPTPDTVIAVPCDKVKERVKLFRPLPYADSTTIEWIIPASGLCNSNYWQGGQVLNGACSLDTLQSKLGNSCNLYAPGVDCFMQDSSDQRMVLHMHPKQNTTLEKFGVNYALVTKSTMSNPQNKPNLPQKFAVKIVDENGNVLQRQQVTLPTTVLQDSFFWIDFSLKQNLLAGKHYHMYIFGFDPKYPNEVNTNFPIWETLGFKALYKCSQTGGTCYWDSIPKKIYEDPLELPCVGIETYEYKSTCGKSYLAQFNIYDHVAPEIVKCPSNITINISQRSCEVDSVLIPPIEGKDNCTNVFKVIVKTPFGDIGDNGGVIRHVTPGVHPITYTIEDVCGNVGKPCTYTITVKEQKGFTLVCKGSTVVSLADSCAFVPADAFVVGVTDLCCQSYHVYGFRMDNNKGGIKVPFCCSDVGKNVTVVLTAVSDCDSTDKQTCMVQVQVQDKSIPRLSCPPDLTVNCLDFDQFNLAKYGKAVAFANCGVTVKDTAVIQLNDCKSGSATRTFIATGSNGNTAFCTQTITIVNNNPLQGTDIIWPRDTVFYDCHATYDPDRAKSPSMNPAYRGCSKALYSHSDQVFFAGGGGICKKILRTWKAIDCCYPYNKPWEKVQLITLRDTVKPLITFCPKDIEVGNFGACTDSVLVNLQSVTATDCGGILKIINDSKYAFSGGADATGRYPNGLHKITFTVYDSCGSNSSCSIQITVSDKKAPSFICNDIITELQDMPGMGIVQRVDIDKLVLKKEDNCCPKDKITVSFAKDTLITTLWFGCKDIGENITELWFTDCNGNKDLCKPKIVIQDNNHLCPTTFKDTLMVAGVLHRPNGQEVEHVEIKLDLQQMVCTGLYKFDSLAPVLHTVTPYKDEDPLEGVTTRDIVKIQRYILGKDTLTPYQIIAADANHDNRVTSADIAEIRRLLLGLIPTFSKNTSWRFVPKAYKFPNNAIDWSFPEYLKVGYGTVPGNRLDADFYGIKIGDIDGNEGNLSPQDEKLSIRVLDEDLNAEYQRNQALIDAMESKILVYPNPVLENLFIDLPKGVANLEVSIFSSEGREIKLTPERSGNTIKINLTQYQSGVYIISVITENIKHQIKVLKI